jgi:hypothetical protein
MTPYERDLIVTVDLQIDSEFLRKIKWIAANHEWEIGDVILNLARHAIKVYREDGYNRTEIEQIIRGIPID